MKTPRLTKRLEAAADFVRQGAVIADVGTDHAYLPIFLCLSGKAKGGVASDIHKGPLRRAESNLRSYGLSETVDTVLCDGLDGLERWQPTDILILGMGGELISDIILRAEFTRSAGVRLILQPMTHPEILRRALYRNGYTVSDEKLAEEDGRIYQILCAEYTGQSEVLTPCELLIGKYNLRKNTETCRKLLRHWQSVLQKRIDGIRKSGKDAGKETALLREMEEYLS